MYRKRGFVIDLQIRQLERSFKHIRDIAIVRDGPNVVLRLRAYEAFAPASFDGLDVDLEIRTASEADALRAKLAPLPVDAPRGTWFPFVLQFRDPADAERVLVDEQNLYSNASRVTFFPQGEPTPSFENPFYKAV